MADPVVLKARVGDYLRQLQADRAKAALTYKGELERIDFQIAAVQRILANWDTKVDTLIDLLTDAGIQVNV